MVETASIALLNYFMPILSFLLVFILVYAILVKTEVLGEAKGVALIISFILGIFFVVNASLVDFVNFSSAWFAVFLVCVFLILVLLGLTGKDAVETVVKNKAVAWILVVGLIIFFIISSAFTFNWALNWNEVWDWFYTDWFGMVLLLVIAAIVGWVVARKVKE